MLSKPTQLALKRAFDVVGAGVGLAIAAPVMAAAAVAIRATMGSPVVFRQRRPGLHGAPFYLRKFRTMTQGNGPDEARMTLVGRVLRATSVDELPSLVNVLRGEMSLVGPRPLLMKYLDRYTPDQARRHDVKPGMTGWAQVNGRNARDWDTKFALDLYYVDNWSLWLDVVILAKTVGAVLRREGISAEGHVTMPEFMGTQRLRVVH